MARVELHQMVKITRRGLGFGEKAQIVSLPKAEDGSYGAKVYWSFWTFKLKRKDFVVINKKRR